MLSERDLGYFPYLNAAALWQSLPATEHTPEIWVWAPALVLGVDCDLDTMNQLIAAGWERLENTRWGLDLDWTRYILARGLLADMRMMTIPGQEGADIWMRSAEIEHIAETPVALAFPRPAMIDNAPADAVQHYPGGTITLQVAQMLPPMQFGEYGLVLGFRDDQMGWFHYPLSVLGDEGMVLQLRLSVALAKLAAPGGWWPHTKTLEVSLRGQHDALHDELQSKLLATRGKEREVWRERMVLLETDRRRALALREARERAERDPAAWLEQWQEITDMTRALAELYSQAHESALHVANLQVSDTAIGSEHLQAEDATAALSATGQEVESTAPAQERRKRAERVPRADLVIKDPTHITIPSHPFMPGIMRALLDGSEYTRYEDRKIAEYRSKLTSQGREIRITITPGDGEGWEHVMLSLHRLGDEVVDVFCAVLALAIDTNGVEHITDPMWVSTDDLLRICQRKMSNGSFTPEQRAATVEYLRTIARVHADASVPAPKRRGRPTTEHRLDSALIDILGQAIGEYKTITGEAVWERRQVKIGEWARLLPPLDKQTAVILRKVLAYHGQRDRHAKRLGRYLTLQFRVNWDGHSGVVECKMGTLLEQAGIKPDLNNASRTRDMLEGALARLRQDGVIGAYGLVVESTPAAQEAQTLIEQRARGWWDVYAQQLWRIEPSDYAREQYRRIPARIDASDSDE